MNSVISFSKSNYLKDLRRHTLGMRSDGGQPWCAVLGNDAVITSTQARVQSNLACQLRKGTLNGIRVDKDDYIHENYLCTFSFHIFHDGESFQLKMWGEFWGNTPTRRFRIDFSSEAVQADLEAAEKAFCAAWGPFGIGATIGKNIGHNPNNIWFNVTIPFKDYEELVSSPFSQHLCGSLTAVANTFASLTKYRIQVVEINNEGIGQQENVTESVHAESAGFTARQHLQTFREHTLGMSKRGNIWATNLSKYFKNVTEPFCLTSKDEVLDDRLRTCLWYGELTEEGGAKDFLAELEWKIVNQDNKPYLQMTGEFRGNHPAEIYKGIDFSSKSLQPVLDSVPQIAEIYDGDWDFGHDSSHIWWNWKCSDYIENPEMEFPEVHARYVYCQGYRSVIIGLASRLVRLLPFRVPVNSPTPKKKASKSSSKEKKGLQFLELALDYDFGRNGKPKAPAKAVAYYEKCLEIMESGLAYFNLALSYLTGDGVPISKDKGYQLMWKAHGAGFPKASFYIASCYEKGRDCSVDLQKAAKLYRIAADKGHVEAAYRLGVMTKNGKGVEKNPREAFRLFGIAVKADEKTVKPEWLYHYAKCLLYGNGTDKDPVAGIDAMRKAAELGNAGAQYEMATAYEFGLGVEKSGEKKWEWMKRAADSGNMHAEFEFGEHLLPTTPELATTYLQRAADKGHEMAQVYLFEAREKNAKSEIDSLTKAAERGNRKAQVKLGMMYLKGEKVARNPRLGFDWLSAAAEQGDMDALAALGWCYLEGTGVPRQNASRAFECFEEAAGPIKKSKNRRALKGLYECYRKGLGTEQNRRLASDIKDRLDYLSVFGSIL